MSKMNNVFDIVYASKKFFDYVERVYRIAREVKIDFENFYAMRDFRFSEGLENRARKNLKRAFFGKIPHDVNVEKYVLAGKSR